MNQNYKIDHTMLLELTLCRAEDETLDYILEGMASYFQNNMPCEEEVKRYLSCPEQQSSLTASQRIIAMDKLVKCADCGSSLNVSYDKKKERYTGFSCWVYKNYGKERCTSHAIGWQTLNRLVLEDIRRNAAASKLATQKYMDMLIAAKTDKKKRETERCKRELKATDKRIGELSKILTKLYEDTALERISEERYQAMAPGYEREQELLKVQREKLTAEIDRSEQVYENIERFLPIIWKYTDITELNAHILNELIERIVVYEKTVNPDGSKSQRVDIHYKFIGYIDTNAWANDRIWIPVGPESDQEQKEAQTA